MHQVRRELGVKFKDLMPDALKEYIYERNRKIYDGDQLVGSFGFFKNKCMGDCSKIILAGAAVALLVGVVVGALVVATGGLAAAAIGVTALQLGVAAGAVTAGVGIAAVAATASQDAQNGTESSLGDYISNAFKASAECLRVSTTLYLILKIQIK